MSTRGAVGFRKNDKDFVFYNHYDSYPSSLGEKVLSFIQETDISELNVITDQLFHEQFSSLPNFLGRLIDHSDPSSINAEQFLLDSLFCEYAYIINLDTQKLEFYQGGNQFCLKNKGRYADKTRYLQSDYLMKPYFYYGVILTKALPLTKIKQSTVSAMIQVFNHRTAQIRKYLQLVEQKTIFDLTTLIDQAIENNQSDLYFVYDENSQSCSMYYLKEFPYIGKRKTSIEPIQSFNPSEYLQITNAIIRKTEGHIFNKNVNFVFAHQYKNVTYCIESTAIDYNETQINQFCLTIKKKQEA